MVSTLEGRGSEVGRTRLLVDDRSGVRTIRLNRPEVRNAVDLRTAKELAAALDELDADETLSVGVVSGDRTAFSAGMDLRAFAESGEKPWVDGRFAGIAGTPRAKPLIAAVEGFALAGGLEIAIACDIIVASRTARFGIPEVRRGLVAAGGGLLRLPHLIPPNVAMELALTGQDISADRAYDLGLVNRVVDPGEALAVAQELAGQIALNAPLAVRASKQILTEGADWPRAEAFAEQYAISGPVDDSNDAREGARAFTEKRPPRWTCS